MEYERLTDKNDLYWALQETKLSAQVGIYLTDCLNRLAELEDKMEQGTLKEIPENAVVLTDKKDIQQFEWSKICDKMGIFKLIEKECAKASKETAEKFAEKTNQAINAYRKKVGEDEYVVDARRLIFEVNEICKEITDKGVQNGD